MSRRQATENTAQERVDAAVVDAYERRIAGQAATTDDDALEAEIAAAELTAYVALHQRVANLPRQDVASGVRSVVLSAAAQAAEEHAAQRAHESPLARALIWLMRPGPLMALVTAAAVVVAVSVRQESSPMATAKADSAVAMAEPAPVQPTGGTAVPAPAAAVAPEAPLPVVPPMVAAAATVDSPPPAATAPAPASAPMARPVRTIEAQAASLGPAALDDAPAAHSAPQEELPKRAAAVENNYRPQAKARAEGAQNDAPSRELEANLDRDAAKKSNDQNADEARVQTLNQRAGNAASAGSAQVRNEAPAAPQAAAEPSDQQAETKNLAARNQVAEKAGADAVARWRQSVEEAQTPEERIAALKQLMVAAQAVGDDKTAKLAQTALKAAQAQIVARKRAESLQETPSAQRAKAAPSQGSGELKAQKSKN